MIEDANGKIVGGSLPPATFANRIARLLNKADKQFQAVNPGQVKFNILAYVNHDDLSDDGDLQEVLLGYWEAGSGERLAPDHNVSTRVVGTSKWRIDLYVWFDAKTGENTALFFNQNDPARVDALCKLINVDRAKIRK